MTGREIRQGLRRAKPDWAGEAVRSGKAKACGNADKGAEVKGAEVKGTEASLSWWQDGDGEQGGAGKEAWRRTHGEGRMERGKGGKKEKGAKKTPP